MVPITTRFTSEAPLHPKASELLATVFERGWADPSKIHEPSREAGRLLQEAKETFAGAFGVRTDEIYFLGEPSLGFHLGINGLLTPQSRLFYSATDRAPVHAIVDHRKNMNLGVLQDSTESSQSADVLVHQSVNPETGIVKVIPNDFGGKVFVDNTAFGVHSHLPTNWATAVWQSRSWQGPSGLGVFAVRSQTEWRNPLPHNDSKKVPQAFSIPLALASAVALENFSNDSAEVSAQVVHFRKMVIDFLLHEIGNVTIAQDEGNNIAYLLSASLAGVDSERLVNELSERGVAVDSGSACMSANMAPSHVLAAMGLPTTGNIRLTLHPQIMEDEIDYLLNNLKELVIRQRS